LRRYEAMFLFDSAVARDWATVAQEVRRLCDRIAAQLLVCVKFDERKLAYEIRKRKRGTYVLTYFDADPTRIGELERDARLSELILRLLVLRADHMTEEKLAKLRAHNPEVSLCPSGDGRRHEERSAGEARPPAGEEQLEEPGAEAVATETASETEVATEAGDDLGEEAPVESTEQT